MKQVYVLREKAEIQLSANRYSRWKKLQYKTAVSSIKREETANTRFRFLRELEIVRRVIDDPTHDGTYSFAIVAEAVGLGYWNAVAKYA